MIHAVLDTSTTFMSSIFLQIILSHMQLPTFSFAFLSDGSDFADNRNNQQISKAAQLYAKCKCFPPVLTVNHLMFELTSIVDHFTFLIPALVDALNLTNAAILYDENYYCKKKFIFVHSSSDNTDYQGRVLFV